MTKNELKKILSVDPHASRFIVSIDLIDDELFRQWYDLKPGDVFLGKPGNSWGHTKEFRELTFLHHFDWFDAPGAKIGAGFVTNYMVSTFLGPDSFGGIVRRAPESWADAPRLDR